MRHVSRTHRVFERTYVDLAISIRYVNTEEQIAHILTKGAFFILRLEPWHVWEVLKEHCSFHCDLTCTTASPVRKNEGSSTLQVQLHLHGSAASWLMSTTTKCDIRLVCRQRERILCGAAFRAASGTALERQTAGGTASGRIVALTSEQAVKSDTQESLSEDTVLRIAARKTGGANHPALQSAEH